MFFSFGTLRKIRRTGWPVRRSSRRPSATVLKIKKLPPRPDWDNTINDLATWKLSTAELWQEAKTKAYKSKAHYNSNRSSFAKTQSSPRIIDAGKQKHGSTGFPGKKTCVVTRYMSQRFSQHNPPSRSSSEGAAEFARRPRILADKSGSPGVATANPELSTNGTFKDQTLVKPFKKVGGISRFGKENRTSLPNTTTTSEYAIRKAAIETTIRTFTQRAATAVAFANTELVLQSRYQEINGPHFSKTTVDFEDEVKEFEAQKKQLLELKVAAVTEPRQRKVFETERTGTVTRRRARTLEQASGKADAAVRFRLRAMDKSSPNRYTRQSNQRAGTVDSSDDSVSGPMENMRWQKGSQSATKHRRPYKKKFFEAEGDSQLEKKQSFTWETQKKELVHFKRGPNISDDKTQSSDRLKMVKRHFGSIQRTSPITDWNGDIDEDSDDHFSRQDFPQYVFKYQHELMKEFKEFKLSISRQIMNLQLDVDQILANQQKKEKVMPDDLKGLSSHQSRQPSTATSQDTSADLSAEDMKLPQHSAKKIKEEMTRPASPSSGESCHLSSSRVHCPYPDTTKAHFRSLPREESCPTNQDTSYGAVKNSQVFHNFQNNPIYHVQSSSDKRGGISDSEASSSSVELTSLNFHKTRGALLEVRPESDGKGYISPEERKLPGDVRRATQSSYELGSQHLKSNGNNHIRASVTYASVPELGKAVQPAHPPRADLPLRDSKPESNGHAHSNHIKTGKLEEEDARSKTDTTLARLIQSGGPKTPGRHEITMSNLGTYNTKAKAGTGEVKGFPDAELYMGKREVLSGKSSPQPIEMKSRPSSSISRPLFREERVKTSWEHASTTSPTTYTKEDSGNQHRQRKGGADPRWHESQNSTIEHQQDSEPFTLRGWAAAFLQPPTEITIKTQEITLQTVSPKPEAPTSLQVLPKHEESVIQQSTKREKHREKENGNQHAIRQFAGKSARGGCAWTVSEPASSPKSGTLTNGRSTSRGRQRH